MVYQVSSSLSGEEADWFVEVTGVWLTKSGQFIRDTLRTHMVERGLLDSESKLASEH